MKKILITGGRGYVGGRVVQWLRGHTPHIVRVGGRCSHKNEGVENFIGMDWSSSDSLLDACADTDIVVHLAAMNEIECARDPIGALEVNGVATLRLLEAAKDAGVSQFLYLSTAHVYGTPLVGRIDEDTLARPRHPYASSHRAAEDAVLACHFFGDLDGMVLRLSNGYGAPATLKVDRWTLLVNDLCQQVVQNGVIVLNSYGSQRRDFIALSDVARGVSHVIDIDWRGFGEPVFNLGGAWAPTVYEMACLVAQRAESLLGVKPNISRPQRAVDVIDQPLDYRIDKLLGTGFTLTGSPQVEIDTTLQLCMQGAASRR